MEDGKTKTEEERIQEIEEVEANVKCMKDFTSPEQLYEELIRSIRKYHPSTDISMIEKAYRIAAKAHEGQKRKSGSLISFIPCVWRSFWRIWSWIKRRSLPDCYTMS